MSATRFHQPLLSTAFLRSVWANEFEAFTRSPLEAELRDRLSNWRDRRRLKETSAEQTFVDIFFRDTWGYKGAGETEARRGFTLHPKHPIKSAGQAGGTGEADLALGWFDRDGVSSVPQVLCEFKDIRSELDTPQKRKKNNRSPVQQCKDYLWGARQGLFGNEPIIPAWGIVTDMNEFRLYWWDRMPQQYMRFIVERTELFSGDTLLDNGDEARFQRFLFYKLFHADTLLTTSGKPELTKLLTRQWIRERQIENEFYGEYREFRNRLYNNLVICNPKFPGTKGQLVRLSQKILDRSLFVFYCEDMGQVLSFPPQLLRDFLVSRSLDPYFDPSGQEIWDRIKGLFEAMNEGGHFPPDKRISRFNGGLFAADEKLKTSASPTISSANAGKVKMRPACMPAQTPCCICQRHTAMRTEATPRKRLGSTRSAASSSNRSRNWRCSKPKWKVARRSTNSTSARPTASITRRNGS